MGIYTKKGDRGITGLPKERRLPKSAPVFEVLGSLDLVNSAFGISVAALPKKEKKLKRTLEEIQQILLSIGATIAAESSNQLSLMSNLSLEIHKLETQIDEWEKILPPLKYFILPGGSMAASYIHLTRSLVRQSERVYQQYDNKEHHLEIDAYLNRLSDYLFQLARYLNHSHHTPEIIWKS